MSVFPDNNFFVASVVGFSEVFAGVIVAEGEFFPVAALCFRLIISFAVSSIRDFFLVKGGGICTFSFPGGGGQSAQ